MMRTYRVPARVDDVDAHVRSIFQAIGAPHGSSLNQAGTIEAVLNAIIHGIFRASTGSERDPIAFLDALRAAESEHEGAEVCVMVDHAPGQDVCTIVVSDPGEGFDADVAIRALDAIDPLAPSGRGLLLMRAAAETVAWNAAGNEVTLRFRALAAPPPEPCSSRYP